MFVFTVFRLLNLLDIYRRLSFLYLSFRIFFYLSFRGCSLIRNDVTIKKKCVLIRGFLTDSLLCLFGSIGAVNYIHLYFYLFVLSSLPTSALLIFSLPKKRYWMELKVNNLFVLDFSFHFSLYSFRQVHILISLLSWSTLQLFLVFYYQFYCW